jgi:hypothetical protein
MANIHRGSLLEVSAGGTAYAIVVETTNDTSFTAYWPNATAPNTSGTHNIQGSSVPATAPNPFSVINTQATPIDASFSGVAPDYMTDDVFHIGISLSDPTAFTGVVIYIYVNGSNPTGSGAYPYGTSPNYYTYLLNSTTGMSGQFDISKRQFTPNGTAIGTGSNTWKKVSAIEIVYGGTSGATITISSIYFASGFTPGVFDQSAGTLVQPYKYIYTYRNVATNAEGNPCVFMTDDNAMNPFRQSVTLTLQGTADPQISTATGAQSIVIYRSCGTYTDGLYRVIGYATNPGGSSTVTFTDNIADADILFADTVEFDNDPPVHSTLNTPISLRWNSWASGSGAAGAYSTMNFSISSGPSLSDIRTYLPAGSTATFNKGGANEETVIIGSWVSSSSVKVWLQNDQTGLGYNAIYASSAVGIPANLAVLSQESIFVAGDPNSPHTLYKSKRGRPDAFPVVELDTGISCQISVGSPSDPIMALTEYGGSVICLNLDHIYVVQVFGQQMQEPIEAPATRGLVGNYAWCKTDNEIWYLGYDGVYSWAGGQSTKRSEAIDPLFKGMTVGPYSPVNMNVYQDGSVTVDPKQRVTFSYQRNTIIITCQDTLGQFMRLRYDLLFNRWQIDYIYDAANSSAITPAAVTAQYLEPDTGYHLISKPVNGSGQFYGLLYLDGSGSSDGWVNAVTDGAPIIGAITPASYNLGLPRSNKQWLDMAMDCNNDNATFTMACYYDYSATADSTDTFSISSGFGTSGRKDVLKSLQIGYGKEAKVMTVRTSWSTTIAPTFYSLTFNYRQLGEVQVGRSSDWDDLGWSGDKRLYVLNVTCDITSGNTVTLNLDKITGSLNNQVVTEAAQSFTLKALTGTFTGPSRTTAQFAITDGTIVKKVRLRPTTSSVPFKLLSYDFGEFEKFPPDVVPFTPWSDYGYPFNKYAEQVVLDVNTDNVAATVTLFVDGGGSPAATFTVTTTTEDRKRTITLPTSIKGKKFRMVNSPGTNGRYQLFDQNIVCVPADKGPVTSTFDWDDLGSPYEKRLYNVTFIYDANATGPITMQMDTQSGTTINTNVQTFSLSGTGRSQQQFTITDGTIATAIRIFPVSVGVSFQHWSYVFEKQVYPPNIVPFTEYNDFNYKHDKYAQQLVLDVNTGGVAASVALQDENGTTQTISVTSSHSTRNQIFTLSPQMKGKKFRILNTPGSNGRFQLWSWDLVWLPADKGPVFHSYDWDDLGHPYDKHLKSITFDYDSNATGPFTVYADANTGINGTTITTAAYTFTLSGTGRSLQSFPFPDASYAKQIRIYPFSDTVTFKEWKYRVDKEDMPADITLWTTKTNLGWPCEKILRALRLDMDTGGVACSVAVIGDGATIATFNVTTTSTDRYRILTINNVTPVKLVNLSNTIGSGGKAQIFDYSFDFVKEPCYLTHFDTLEATFGLIGWRWIRDIWLEYISASPVTFSVYREQDVLFYQVVLPAHSYRDVEQFFLPPNVGAVLNKSREHRIVIDSASGIKIYQDESKMELVPCGTDQRIASVPLTMSMQPQL